VGVALFCALLAQGGLQIWRGDHALVHQWMAARLRDDSLAIPQVNNRAYLLALGRGVDRRSLELARDRIDAVLTAHPTLDGVWDTKAALEYRLGDYDQAVRAARRAFALAPRSAYASRLARVLGAHLERDGIARRGTVPEQADASIEGQRIVVTLSEPLPAGSLIVLIASDGAVVRLILGRVAEASANLLGPEGFSENAVVAVALVDSRTTDDPPPRTEWQVIPIRERPDALPPD
jgi:hypothetical protein